MRKIIISIITILLIALTFTACQKNVDDIVNKVSIDDIIEKIENKETFAFIIGADDCPACQVYKENLAELKDKKDVVLDYVNFNTEDEKKVLELLINYLGEDISNGLSTPTTYFINKGEHTGNPVIGAVTKSEVVKMYETEFDNIEKIEAINIVTIDDVIEKIKKEETFAFVIGSNTCRACLQYKNTLKDFYKETEIQLDYINIDKETDEKLGELLIGILDQDLSQGLSTPTTHFIIQGKHDGEPAVGAMGASQILERYNKFEKDATE